MLTAYSMKPITERSEELAALVGELRRLLASPAEASAAWDFFHHRLMRHADFLPRSEPCTRPALIDAVELALEELSGERFPLGELTLASADDFEVVHGFGVAGGNLVFIIFCERTRCGLIGLPFLKSGKLMLLSFALSGGDASFVMAPASC